MHVRMLIPVVGACVGAVTALTGSPAAHAASAATLPGHAYVVQGLLGATLDISVDGRTVASGAAAKGVVGPLELAPGGHTLVAASTSPTTSASATFNLNPGDNVDIVVHRQVDPTKPPMVTTFLNDLSPVAAGTGRVSVTHTAAVGPADIRVDGKVAFANVANGESLSLVVPAKRYSVDIVPTTTTGPTVFGPADLPVAANALTRVFAIGVAADHSMDAVVQVLPLGQRGSAQPPAAVPGGTGGQAAALTAGTQTDLTQPLLLGLGGLLAAMGAYLSLSSAARRLRGAPARSRQ